MKAVIRYTEGKYMLQDVETGAVISEASRVSVLSDLAFGEGYLEVRHEYDANAKIDRIMKGEEKP